MLTFSPQFSILVRNVMLAFVASLAVPAVATAARGGSSESVASATLALGLLTTSLHAALWLAIMLLDHVAELATSSRATLLGHAACVVGVPLALAAADAAFAQPFLHVLLELCALLVSGLVVRENQKSRGARSGSNALQYFQLLVGGIFAALLGVFLLSYLQSALG